MSLEKQLLFLVYLFIMNIFQLNIKSVSFVRVHYLRNSSSSKIANYQLLLGLHQFLTWIIYCFLPIGRVVCLDSLVLLLLGMRMILKSLKE